MFDEDKKLFLFDINSVYNSEFKKREPLLVKEGGSVSFKLIKKGEIEMYLNKKWFILRPLKKLKDLDVTVLKRLILNKILRNNNNLQFVSGIKGKKALEKLVNTKKYNIAFKLYPTDISQVISFAEKKKFMPQKSTWFHPKPLDGLISSRIIS